ncbi:MAG: nucleotide-binding protein [Betaproteobacteria bacterium]|nr:nucleotide-binding protein [Betaproteobacteria bacterium]
MKTLLAIFLTLFLGASWAANPPAAAPLKGEVLEVIDANPYTYLRLKTTGGETWAAVAKAPVKKGTQVTIENPMVMSGFESKSLKRTFDKIVFGSLAGAGGATASADVMSAHSGIAKTPDVPVEKVAKAAGPDARTVAEVTAQKAQLKGKTVIVRGKVVKFSAEIMGKNWVHLRDGTGSSTDGSNDLLVTTKQVAAVGDIVNAKGLVRTDADFGSGYSYKVLVEEATLQK